MKTYTVKAKEIVPRWHVVDAADQPLGRLAARVAAILRGKHRPDFTPYLDMREFVVVVNAERVHFSGNKMRGKIYYRHTQHPGGLREVTLEKMMATHPTRVIEHAVRGMLPHNRLGAKLRRHLKVYVGPEHPHQAQTGGAPKKPKVAVAEKPAAAPAPEAVVEEPVVAEAPVEEPKAEAAVESVAEETPEAVAEEPAEEAPVETSSEDKPAGEQGQEES